MWAPSAKVTGQEEVWQEGEPQEGQGACRKPGMSARDAATQQRMGWLGQGVLAGTEHFGFVLRGVGACRHPEEQRPKALLLSSGGGLGEWGKQKGC